MNIETYVKASKIVGYIGGAFLGVISIVVMAVFLSQFRRATTNEERNRDLVIGVGVGGAMMLISIMFIIFSRFALNFST